MERRMKAMFPKKEIEIMEIRAVVHSLQDGINLELVGNREFPKTVDELAKRIADEFGGIVEIPDHPATSHIRLIHIKGHNDVEKFITELFARGF